VITFSCYTDAAQVDADRCSSNATKPLLLVPIVYDEVGSAQDMGRIFAGLPNMSASALCRMCHPRAKVMEYLYDKHHSSHYTTIGTLQAQMDFGRSMVPDLTTLEHT
jgi:hypothetical protein